MPMVKKVQIAMIIPVKYIFSCFGLLFSHFLFAKIIIIAELSLYLHQN